MPKREAPKFRTCRARSDLIDQAIDAFERATPGNVRLSVQDVLSGGLALMIERCEGRLLPLDQVQALMDKAVMTGAVDALRMVGVDAVGARQTDDGGYIVQIDGRDPITLTPPKVDREAIAPLMQ